jgi:hypothetical protein
VAQLLLSGVTRRGARSTSFPEARLADLTTREQRLRVREAELAAAAAAEQNQWSDLNRRLDDLERSLSVREAR